MKKYLTMIAAITIVLSGCSKTSIQQGTEERIIINYSLMYDEKVQNEIEGLLKESQVIQGNIDLFMDSLNMFNDAMGEMKGVYTGFHEGEIPLEFDYEHIYSAWQENYVHMDQNCRLTTFTLMKDFIKVKTDSVLVDEDNYLMFDLAAIEENPAIKFTEEEVKAFNNFYMAIPVKNTTDQQELVKAIKEEWENRGVEFSMEDNISVINVYLHYPESNSVFIGHTGVLIETDEGYVFIEKLSFEAPYVASKFKTFEEFKVYLGECYNDNFTPEGAAPIYMKNNEWLEMK